MKINTKRLFYYFSILIFVFSNSSLYGQRVNGETDSGQETTNKNIVICNKGDGPYERTLDTSFGISSNSEANSIVEEILSIDGSLKTLVKVQAAIGVGTAEACLAKDGTYRIFFDRSFFKDVERNKYEYWRDRAILAHEVGHIAGNHFIKSDTGSTKKIEILADEFAGEILSKMNATLEQTQAPFSDKIFDCGNCDTHPPIPERLEAVKRGWEKGQEAKLTRYNQYVSVGVDLQNKEGWLSSNAVKELDKAIELLPSRPEAHYYRSTYYYSLAKRKSDLKLYKWAIADYTYVIEFNWNFTRNTMFAEKNIFIQVLGLRGKCYEAAGDLVIGNISEKKEYFAKALKEFTSTKEKATQYSVDIDNSQGFLMTNKEIDEAIERVKNKMSSL